MKKWIALILLAACAVCAVCFLLRPEPAPPAENWDLIPMVQVDGVRYLTTGYPAPSVGRQEGFDGEITSTVSGSQAPTEDDQSNFGTGFGYQYGEREGTIEIFMGNQWWIYATEEVRHQIQFPDEAASP